MYSGDRVLTKFKTTPPMQPYLLEVIVSDFGYVEASGSKRVPQRVYGRRTEALQAGLVDAGLFDGLKIFEEQQRYFNTSFPLPKLDTAVHPAAGSNNYNIYSYLLKIASFLISNTF